MFRKSNNKILLIVIFTALILVGGYLFFQNKSTLKTQENGSGSRKNIEQYFIETMNVTPENAKEMASNGVDLRVSDNTTLQGIVGNLYYYGFIDRNEDEFIELLESTKDVTPGKEKAVKVGNNDIDINASYYVNKSMTDEEVAVTLINKPRFSENFKNYNYLFMPSAPSGSSERPAR